MDRFARLLDELVYTPSRSGKLALLIDYFRSTPDPDRGWALGTLTDGLMVRLPLRRVLAELMTERFDPVLYRLSRDYVGDTAETVALLWTDAPDISSSIRPSLDNVVQTVRNCPPAQLTTLIGGLLDRLDGRGRWALLKLLGGAARVGVSARLAKTAIAVLADKDVAEIEELWHAISPPYADLFRWIGGGPRPEMHGRPLFRPLMLATPVEDGDWAAMAPDDFIAEWKWDGIRVQIAAVDGEARVYSRTGDDISGAFPEIAASFAGLDVTADCELLVARDGTVAAFNDLQQRLNRKLVSARMLKDFPAHVRLYDLLLEGREDWRPLPFVERRQRLEAWHRAAAPALTDLSSLVPFDNWEELGIVRDSARAAGIEGLMLKRKSSPYLSGRPKGHWFKWKRSALTLDCVLMYAQRGSGKRSSFYSDYTFGVWRQTENGATELVPIGKAYSGFTDEELRELDRFIRQNTIESFGPVRSVRPQLVFEVAFDAVQPSTRHKSGIAMRFPRIHRIRWDKPAAEADTLEAAKALIEGANQTADAPL